DLDEPPVDRDDLRYRAAFLLLQVRAEGGDVVEQAAGLVLARVDAGPQEELALVVARFRYPGMHPQPAAVRGADQFDFLGGETQFVEAAQPLLDPEALLVARHDLLAGELVPQPFVAGRKALGHLQRVEVSREEVPRPQVEQLPEYPLHGELDVEPAQAVRQFRVPLTGLRVE